MLGPLGRRNWNGSFSLVTAPQPLLRGCLCCANAFLPVFIVSLGRAGVNRWQRGSATWPSGQKAVLLGSHRRAFSPSSSFEVPSPHARGSWCHRRMGGCGCSRPVPTFGGRKFLGAVLFICWPPESRTKKWCGFLKAADFRFLPHLPVLAALSLCRWLPGDSSLIAMSESWSLAP